MMAFAMPLVNFLSMPLASRPRIKAWEILSLAPSGSLTIGSATTVIAICTSLLLWHAWRTKRGVTVIVAPSGQSGGLCKSVMKIATIFSYERIAVLLTEIFLSAKAEGLTLFNKGSHFGGVNPLTKFSSSCSSSNFNTTIQSISNKKIPEFASAEIWDKMFVRRLFVVIKNTVFLKFQLYNEFFHKPIGNHITI